jgi:Protein of unknown function (DUF3037)
MRAHSSFDYATVRVVPRVERGEFINAGVILYCRTLEFLGARIALDRARLTALDPSVDMDEVACALENITLVCSGDPRSGPIGRLDQSERFHWLVAPRSTITQTSPVHSGLSDDPAAALDRLLEQMVLMPR